MSDFLKKLRSILPFLQPKPLLGKVIDEVESIETSSFWEIFGEWRNTIPGSSEEMSSMERIRFVSVFKKDLLLAYYILENDTPLKKVLRDRIKSCEISIKEKETAIMASIGMSKVIRK